jgi:AraC-like DNA-binding protein
MQHLADWYFALVFFVTLLGFLVSGILYFVNKTDTFSSRLLAGFLVCICILLFNNEMMASRFFLNFPHLWRVAVFASFSFQAFGYIYVRSVLEQTYRFKKWDWLFFMPAFLYTLTLIPFYLLPAAEKLTIIHRIIANNALIAKEPESILPPGLGTLSRSVYGLGTSIAQYILLFKWKRKLKLFPENYDQNKDTYRWLFYFTSMMMALYVVAFMLITFQLTVYFSIWQTVIFAITITILFIVGYLLRKPAILYGMTGWLQQTIPASMQEKGLSEKPLVAHLVIESPRNSLTIEQGLAYKALLENHFVTKHPYIKSGYTMSDLSNELGIPSHQLSAFINQEYAKNFNELINNYRVAYLVNLVKSSSEYQNYTLEALGHLAGFKSRASFYAAVKKKTSLTPAALFSFKNAESGAVMS